MNTTKESDKMLLTDVFQNIKAAKELVDDVVSKVDDPEILDRLKQAERILHNSQGLIVETVVKNMITGYLQADKTGQKDEMTLDIAVALINKVEKKAAQMGISVITAVYNSAANPVAIHCMDNAYIASFDIAGNKAYTSAALKMPTSVLKNLAQPGQELYGIQFTNQGRIVIFGGGEPLYHNNRLIGALGVSGGSESEDTQLARFGKDIMEEVMK